MIRATKGKGALVAGIAAKFQCDEKHRDGK